MSTRYDQKEKNIARERLIVHAIKSLTENRSKCTLVNKQHMYEMLDNFIDLIAIYVIKKGKYFDIKSYKEKIIQEWNMLYEAKNEDKKPHQLKVLYLAGDQPTNDLKVLLENGVKPYNIWAVEVKKDPFKKAVEDLKEKKHYIRLHKGSLKSFLESYPENFDIIYFDACSPLFSNEHNPIYVLKELFINRRLTSLSALITNFSEPDSPLYEEWSKTMACWYAVRTNDCPTSTFEGEFADVDFRVNEIKEYSEFIARKIPEYYSDFIRRFIPSLASEIIPFLKVNTFKSISSKFFKSNESKNLFNEERKIEGGSLEEILQQTPHYMLAVGEYPLLNWVRLSNELLSKDNPLWSYINNNQIINSIFNCTQLKNFEESYSGFNTLIKESCSDKLIAVLNQVDFFDKDIHLTVDTPLKNLIAELVIGQYSFPYITNLNSQLSLKYKAKETWMYSDVFILDQCRYLYDFLPTLELMEDFFDNNIGEQIVIRCCIDGILRNHYNLNSHLLKGGFIESLHDERFPNSRLDDRININHLNEDDKINLI